MATKSRKKKVQDPETAVIEAALRLAAERGWSEISLGEIAAASQFPLSAVYPRFHSKQAILDAFSRRIDAAVIADEEAEAEILAGTATRDRLFDVLMRRFDALQPWKESLANIVYDQLRNPAAGLCSLPQLFRSMRWMLEAAGVSVQGWRGLLRVKAIAAIYLATLRVWLRDDSEDMARTMAALDRHLRRAEQVEGWCSGRLRRRDDETRAPGGEDGSPQAAPGNA